MAKEKCNLCSEPYDLDEFEQSLAIPQIMKEKGLCWDCAYWTWRKIMDDKLTESSITLVIDKDHIIIHKDKAWSGNSTAILTENGKVYIPHRIYYQGVVPVRFKSQFPNNAIYLSSDQLEYIQNLAISKGLGLALITVPQEVVQKMFSKFYKKNNLY